MIRNDDKGFPFFHAFMVAGLILFFSLAPVAPVRWRALYDSYGTIAIISMAAIYFYKCRANGCKELKLVIFYTLWLFVTRLLNTDLYLENELDLVISRVLCCVVLPTGLLLEGKARERFLDILIALLCAFYLIVAVLGIYACFLGIYFFIPPEDVAFGIHSSYLLDYFYYIVPLDTTRTISSLWFYICWCLMVYEFIKCRSKLWRVLIALAGFVFYLAIALSFCRAVKLAVCVNLAMLVILWGMQHLSKKSLRVRVLIISLLAVLSLPLGYKSFDLMTFATQKLYEYIDPDVERSSDEYMMFQYMDEPADDVEFKDKRDLGKSISNVSQRGSIYLSTIPTLKEDPMRMLIGKYSDKIMLIPQKYLNYSYVHMHNYILQTLMLTGIIGCLLVLSFSVLLVIRMIRLFFSTHPVATSAVKSLTLPLSGIMLYGMFETVIFANCADDRSPTDFRELMFFLLAGIVLAYYYDVFPKHTNKKPK